MQSALGADFRSFQLAQDFGPEIPLHAHARLALELCPAGTTQQCRSLNIFTDGSAILDQQASWSVVITGVDVHGQFRFVGSMQGRLNDDGHMQSFAEARCSSSPSYIIVFPW